MNFASKKRLFGRFLGKQRLIVHDAIASVALSQYALIANPIIPKNPKIFVPHQFSVKFMSKKADKLQKILVLHPKIRNQR